MSLTVSIHRIVSLPLSNPNRGMDGLPKTLYYGGVLRSRVSSQCIKAALRDQFDPGSIGLDPTVRSTVVAQMRIAPALKEKGLSEASAVAATSALMALFVGEKAESAAATAPSSGEESEEDEKAGQEKKGSKREQRKEKKAETIDELPTSAPLVLGEREIEALIEVAYTYAKFGAGHDLRKLFEGRGRDKVPVELAKAVEALRAIKTKAGLDGALFGRMATGVAISRVDSAVSVAHAMGVGPVQSVADAWTAQDQLRETPGAGHISTRELISGVFLLEVFIDMHDLRRNIPGLSDDQERALVEMIVARSRVGNPRRWSGPPRPMPTPVRR